MKGCYTWESFKAGSFLFLEFVFPVLLKLIINVFINLDLFKLVCQVCQTTLRNQFCVEQVKTFYSATCWKFLKLQNSSYSYVCVFTLVIFLTDLSLHVHMYVYIVFWDENATR